MSITKCTMQIGGQDLYTKRSADTVTYSNTTVAQVLQNYKPPSAGTSDFGKKILACKNADEFRNLLRAGKLAIYDEADEYHWLTTGDVVPSHFHKPNFVNNSLLVTSSQNARRGVTLSTKCTIDFWMYSSTTSNYATYFKLYNSDSLQYALQTLSDATMKFIKWDSATIYQGSNYMSLALQATSLRHYQFCSNGSKIFVFANGILKGSIAVPIYSAKYTLKLGASAACWFSEPRVLNGVCEHTANFSVPTEKYSLTPETVSLVHFD